MSQSWADHVEQEEQDLMVSQYTHWQLVLLLSKNRDNDKFNNRGINISAQCRRQNLEPWLIVDRSMLLQQHNLDHQDTHAPY